MTLKASINRILAYVTAFCLIFTCAMGSMNLSQVMANPDEQAVYLSDLTWTDSANGAGFDIGINKSMNGTPLSIKVGGVDTGFPKGIGMHAFDENDKYAFATYDISGKGYTRFKAFVGPDTAGWGSITFEVLVDTVKKYELSCENVWTTGMVDIDVTGASTVTLRVGNRGNGNNGDHADWCDARFIKSGTSVTQEDTKVYINDLACADSANGAGLDIGINKSASGSALSIKNSEGENDEYPKGLGMHAMEENDKYAFVTYDISGKGYTRFKAFVGPDTAGWGSITFEVLVDTVKKYELSCENVWTTGTVDVDVTGGSTVTLRVGNRGNGNNGDHADWCDAYFLLPGGQAVPDNTVNGIKLHSLSGISNFDEDTLLTLTTPKIFEATNGETLPYRIYLPSNYTATKDYPVVVFLHGVGNCGTDNKGQIKDAVPLYNQLFKKQKNGEEFIIVAPQCPSGSQWVNHPFGTNYSTASVAETKIMAAAVELVESLSTTYSTDTNKYYVTGNSMGGYGVFDVITRHPNLFKAALEFYGGGDPTAVSAINSRVWVFHGNADTIVNVGCSQAMVNALEAANKTVKYTEYDNWGHALPDSTQLTKMIDWLFDPSEEKAVYVSDIQWKTGWTDCLVVARDVAASEKKIKLRVDGQEKIFDKGIGTHAESSVQVDITGMKAKRFEAYAGPDLGGWGTMRFEVKIDGTSVFDSGMISYTENAKKISVNIPENARTLELNVLLDGGSNNGAHASWGDAKIILNADDYTEPPQKTVVTCVGDSLTEGVASYHGGAYPDYLQALLGADNYWVKNCGRGGATLMKETSYPYFGSIRYNESIESEPNTVIIMLGTNDTIPSNWTGKAQYITDYIELINTYKALPTNPTVYLCTSPAYEDESNGQGATVKNELIPLQIEVAKQSGCKLIDIYTMTNALSNDVYADGLHFKNAGYEAIAQKIHKVITGVENGGFEGDPNSNLPKPPVTPEKSDNVVYLSDLDWKSASSGWNSVQKDKNVSGGTITLVDASGNPVPYEKGLGTHAESTIIYDLTGLGAKEFNCFVGADAGEGGTVSFEVYVDDVKKFDSELMEQQNAAKLVTVDVTNAKILKLVVTNGNGNNACDHASWADAKLTVTASNTAEKPKYVSTWLSDIKWKSATSGWQTVQLNKEVNGNPIILSNSTGSTTTYEKGLGVHAPSEIIYDIAGKGYITFESLVGADFGEGGTVKFQVWVDGAKKYESPLMEQQNAAEFVSVGIEGAKELKLVVTEGNGSKACDHASWANAKLIGLAGVVSATGSSPKTGEDTSALNAVSLIFVISAGAVLCMLKKKYLVR